VHTFTQPAIEDCDIDAIPSIEAFRFRGPIDVVARAEVDPGFGRFTWPEVWHLDEDGELQCYFDGSSCDSIARWAEEPWDLFVSRRYGLADGGCPDRWLIIEHRPRWRRPAGVTEADAAAFAKVREHLAGIGVTLVDCMVFDDDGHWWSLHELTSGTLDWPEP
jgi:hypothetical protein